MIQENTLGTLRIEEIIQTNQTTKVGVIIGNLTNLRKQHYSKVYHECSVD